MGEEPAVDRVFLCDNSDQKCAADNTDDLRTHVLDNSCLVELHGSGCVTDKAGDTHGHVLGISHIGQDCCYGSQEHA